MISGFWKTNTALATGLVVLATSGAAMAQDAAPNDGLDVIVVTAERREESLQEVPISATVLTGEDLDRRGVANLNDIQNVAPSVAISTFNRSTFVNIRCVGIAQSAPTSNPGVAYYIDGVLIPHEQHISQSFYDIGTIEVLRGPQGTLTGQNSTGGAIYVSTPQPEFGSTFGYVDATVGNYNRIRGVAAINVGGENVAARIAAVHDARDSFTTNIGPSGSQPGNTNLDAVRATVRLRGDDGRFDLRLRGEYFVNETDNNAVKNRNDLTGTDLALRDPFTISEDGRSFMDQEGYRVSADARYDLSESVAVRGMISWSDADTLDQTDGDRTSTAPAIPAGLPANGANRARFPGRVSNATTTFETLIAEFNVLSIDDGPLQWVVGGFLLDETVPVSLFRDNHSTADFVSSDSDIVSTAENSSQSVFGQINYYVTDAFEVVAGARYSHDEQNYIRFALPGPPQNYPVTTPPQASDTLTGKLALNYHFDDSLLYFSASKGFKAGGVNLDPSLGNFGPETNFVYELGFKTELADNHLRINGDVFYSDYNDIQLSSLVPVGPALLPQTQNAAGGESWGAELEVLAQFGGFGANLGIGYLDAQFAGDACITNTNTGIGEFPTPTPSPCTAGNSFIPDGAVLPYSPEWTINAGVEYMFFLNDDVSVTPRLQWSHTDTQYVTPFQSSLTVVPSYDLFNARVSIEFEDDYLLELFANNLTNETYIGTQIQNSTSADGGIIYGAPRTFGVRFKVNFGG